METTSLVREKVLFGAGAMTLLIGLRERRIAYGISVVHLRITSSADKVTSTSAETTSRSTAETTSKAKPSQAQETETATSGSVSITATSETAATTTSAEPNSAWKMGSSLGISATLAIGAVYLARVAF
ncbi:hypothetical protein LB505_001175 [Fusarium chuoi]|nr:hypothetical protein LB505_001175 [Fusarium chuoi]